MVDGESAVLPAPAAFGSADPDDSLPVFESDAPSEARPSRPFQDNGWMDEDAFQKMVALPLKNPGKWYEKIQQCFSTSDKSPALDAK